MFALTKRQWMVQGTHKYKHNYSDMADKFLTWDTPLANIHCHRKSIDSVQCSKTTTATICGPTEYVKILHILTILQPNMEQRCKIQRQATLQQSRTKATYSRSNMAYVLLTNVNSVRILYFSFTSFVRLSVCRLAVAHGTWLDPGSSSKHHQRNTILFSGTYSDY